MTAVLTSPVSGATKQILYIENHEDSRLMLATLLGLADYKVMTATSVTDGLNIARLERFDLYILADRFSDGTGLDLCRRIRAFDPDTPVIFFSSAAYASDIEAGIAVGAQHYLIKPLGVYAIEQTVTKTLGGTAKARANVQ